MADPILKILVDVQNSEEVKKLTKDVHDQEKAIAALNAQLQAGKINEQQFTAAAEPLAQRIQAANTQLNELVPGLNKLGGGGRGAAMGMLQLGYAIDDLQYGVGAVVNNIPQLIYMMGGGAGMAGAAGILAVALNLLYKHWDELSGALQNTAPFETAKGLLLEIQEAIKPGKNVGGESGSLLQAIEAMVPELKAVLMLVQHFKPAWEDATRAAEEHTKAVKETEEALKKVAGVEGGEAKERSGVFTKALEAAGGGEKVLKEAVDAEAKRQGIKDQAGREALRDHIAREMAKGMAGGDVNTRQFGPGFEDRHAEEQAKHDAGDRIKKQEQLDKELADVKAKDDAEEKRNIREQFEEKKRARMQALEDRRDAAMEQRKQIQDEFKDARSSQVMSGGAKSAIDLYQSSVGKKDDQKIALLKASDAKLKGIHEEMKKERRLVLPK